MARHTLKNLRCEHLKSLKYIWPFFDIMHERVKLFFDRHCKKKVYPMEKFICCAV